MIILMFSNCKIVIRHQFSRYYIQYNIQSLTKKNLKRQGNENRS